MSSETSTLYALASLVATMLGILLLYFGRRDRMAALTWWGAAYLVGAFTIAIWVTAGSMLDSTLSALVAAIGIGACGLVWTAARVFHGRKPVPTVLAGGIVLWLVVLLFPETLAPHRLTIGAAIVAIFVGLSAGELWSERRKTLKKGWPALGVPVLHAGVLMLPILIGDVFGDASGSSIWGTVFAIELVLYAVGTAFAVFILLSERTVRLHKAAALTDPLTGMFNRRGFAEATEGLISNHKAASGAEISLLVFDIDRFKSINDRFGHPAGDEILKAFAEVVTGTLRNTDISGRLGGEEFAALLPCGTAEALVAAERVREAFATSGIFVDELAVETTVSVGIASGSPGVELTSLLMRADEALYRAKHNGRNRSEVAEADTSQDVMRPETRRMKIVRRRPQISEQPV